MDHPRVSEEVEIRTLDAPGRDRKHPSQDQATEAGPILEGTIASSDNLFRDFNIANADLRHAKATLAGWIMKALDEQGLSTRDAEAKTGIAHSEFSRIRNVKLTRFTLDRLFVIHEKLEPEARLFVGVKRP